MTLEDVRKARAKVRAVHMDHAVEVYVVALVRATRSHPSTRLGASPRAVLALGALSQAIAWTEGRDHVMPEDVQTATRPVLCHRVVAKEASAAASARIVEDALRSVAVPP